MAKRTFEMNFKLGAELAKNFGTTMKGAQSVLANVQGELSKVAREAASIDGLRKQREAVDKAAAAHTAAVAHLKKLGSEYRSVNKPTAAMTREMKRAQQAVDKTSTHLSSQRTRLQSLASAAGLAGASMKDLERRQKALAAQANRTRVAQQKLQGAINARDANSAKMGQARGRLVEAAAIGASLAIPIKQSMEWEQRLAELNKVAALTPDQLKGISRAAQDMAVSTGVAREEIIGAYTAAAQAGFARDEWEQFADVSAKMGVAFDVTGDDAGEMLKAWRSGMGLTMKEAELLAASANHLANNMNATASDVGQVLQRQGAVLKAAGIGGTDASALAASLLSGGASPEVAATAAKNFAKALSKGDAVTGNERQALAMLGFDDPAALAKQMQEAPREAIMGVLESIKGLTDDEQLGVMTKLFGSESIGAIAPLVGNLDNLKNAFSLVGDEAQYAASLQAEFDAMGSTSLQNSKKFSEQMKVLATQIGDVLKPALTGAMEAMMPILNSVSKWAEENPKLVQGIVLVAGTLGALTVGVIAATYVFTALRGVYLSVKVAMAAVRAAQIGLNVAMLANPVFLVIAGIAALIAIGILLWKNWDKVSAFFSQAWATMKAVGAETIESLKASISSGMASMREKVAAGIEWIKGVFIAGLGFVKKLLWDWNPHVIIAKHMLALAKAPEEMIPKFLQSGKDLIGALVDGIKAMASAPVDALKGVLSGARDLLPFSDAKEGPLSQLTASGRAIMETLGAGIKSAGSNPLLAPFSEAAGFLAAGPKTIGGGLLGAASGLSGGGGGTQVTLHLTQNISVASGSGAEVREQAKAGATAGSKDLLAAFREALNNERRTSFG